MSCASLLWGGFVVAVPSVGVLGLPQERSEVAAASPECHRPELPFCVVTLCVIFPSFTHKLGAGSMYKHAPYELLNVKSSEPAACPAALRLDAAAAGLGWLGSSVMVLGLAGLPPRP